MRKVMTYKWERVPRVGSTNLYLSSRVEAGPATFHAFGTDYEELSGGVGLYPCAIVEYEGGRIESLPIGMVEFIDEVKP